MIKELVKNTLLGDLYRRIRMNKHIRLWKKEHNYDSSPAVLYNPKIVSIGKWSYGELNVISFNNVSHLYIGNFVSIAQRVTFLLDVEHSINTISTYPYKKKVLKGDDEAFSKGDIIVDDDVWIGYGATILSGVHIGQGAVVAAGAVVSKDVPPYAVVGGVPGKVIKYRFSQEIIDYFNTLDYNLLTEDAVKEHINDIYETVGDDLQDVKKRYGWFPKKMQENGYEKTSLN